MNQIASLTWRNDEDEEGRYGEGISRPKSGAKTRQFQVIVYPQSSRPLRWTCMAESKSHALRYAANRWPGAAVELA